MRTLDLALNPQRHHPGSPRFQAWLSSPISVLCALILASGCVAIPAQTASAPVGTFAPSGGQFRIYAPATTSSVPIILAASELEPAKLTIFSNHSQANTLFLRGDIEMLVTGLSVGVQFFHNGAPVQVVSCYVSGLTYLVTSGKPAAGFADLRGGELYVPFEGSPIEEASKFLAEQEGLVWKRDIKPIYAASDSALALLKQGKAAAVALPEPFVTLAEQAASRTGSGAAPPRVFVDFGYAGKWNAATGSETGYPQVCTFVRKDWASTHGPAIDSFNRALAQGIESTLQNPAVAAQQSGPALGFEEEVLLPSLDRTEFNLSLSDRMVEQIRDYYRTIGKPLDSSYDSFFYR